MRRIAALSAAAALSLVALIATSAVGQNSVNVERTTEQRLRQLETEIAALTGLVRLRTDAGPPDDRISRDFNLEMRLSTIERTVQQIGNELLMLQRQVSEASQAASQAQNEARMAQQMARDAAMRIN